MKKSILNFINSLLSKKNLELMRVIKRDGSKEYKNLKTQITYLDIDGEIKYIENKITNLNTKEVEKYVNWLNNFVLKQTGINLFNILKYENDSLSQYKQDLFVLSELEFKKNGYFVEFGATNGKDISNTFLLEKIFNWKGILAEPAKQWHTELLKNRNCDIEKDCVWSDSNIKLEFVELGVLSTLGKFQDSDNHNRSNSRKYLVNTISLNDLLKKYDAPSKIDYLSIDTEGSEFDILKSLDFDKYKIKIITVEHNHTNQRDKIFKLLSKNGYKRVFTEVSYCDDWYVLSLA